jgi:hypothetical protein
LSDLAVIIDNLIMISHLRLIIKASVEFINAPSKPKKNARRRLFAGRSASQAVARKTAIHPARGRYFPLQSRIEAWELKA